MARPTKKRAAPLRKALREAHEKRTAERAKLVNPASKHWTQITKERIATTKLLARLQNHALGVTVKKTKDPMRRSLSMGEFLAIQLLLKKTVPDAPKTLEINGNVDVSFPDPTNRPAGYKRKEREPEQDD